MKTLLITCLALCFSAAATLAEVTLEQIDSIRGPQGEFTFTVTSLSDKNKQIELNVRVKDSRRSLVRYVEPKGRTLLFIENDMWIYIAGTRRELRISPRQRQAGGAAATDIARLTYSGDYIIEGIEDIGDGRRILNLKRQSKKVAYESIDLTIAGDEGRPVEAVFYTSSGDRIIKTAYFEEYRHILGRERPTQFRIIDHLDDDNEIILTYSDFKLEKTPDNWFNPAYLKRLK